MLVVLARLMGFVGAAVLAGAPITLLRVRSDPPAARGLLAVAAALVLAGASLSLVGQTQVMAGDPAAGRDPAMLWTVLSATGFGKALGVRALLGLAAAGVLLLPARRARWASVALLGLGVLATFAWTGHGAADQGAAGLVHLLADLAHLLAAGAWLGALAAFLAMLAAAQDRDRRAGLAEALHGFAGIGSAAVAVLLLTGLVNSWFLVGPDHLAAVPTSAYGRLLIAKVVLFVAMVGFAALNRFRLTPALAAGDPKALPALGRSVGLETAAGFLILLIVAALGAMAPPTAQ